MMNDTRGVSEEERRLLRVLFHANESPDGRPKAAHFRIANFAIATPQAARYAPDGVAGLALFSTMTRTRSSMRCCALSRVLGGLATSARKRSTARGW